MQPSETVLAATAGVASDLGTSLEPRTTQETLIRHLYADALGLPDDRVSVDASFFSLGGDSLLATLLMAQINRAFATDLPMRIVFEADTVERLAAQIDALAQRPPQGRPLALRQAGSRDPLFCIHPASGFGRPYLTLLPHLQLDLPVYALEACGLLDGDVLPASIDDMCADYLEQILAIQATGSYHLLGWSFGAIAAHALATQMQKRGLTVARLVMIDGSLLENEPWPAQMIADHRLDLEERLAGYKDYRDASGALKRTMVERMSAIQQNNIRLSYYRHPRVFAGDVLLIRPEVGSSKGRGEVWRPYLRGNLTEVVVPCHHNKLLTPEAVEYYGVPLADFLQCTAQGLDSKLPVNGRDWHNLLHDIRHDRCDLDVLLRDEWRHKVVVRDDAREFGRINTRSLTIGADDYVELQRVVHSRPDTSLISMALVSLHRVLEAYGNGAKTVIGCITDHPGVQTGNRGLLLPSVVDHRRQEKLTCSAAIAAIEHELREECAFVATDELLHRGWFDAVLLVTKDVDRLSSLAPLPLAVAVCDDPVNSSLQWTIAYAAALFEDAVIGGVFEIIREVLRQLSAHPLRLMADLDLISDEQTRQLDRWNATDGDFPQDMRLNELFERAVLRSPEACAIVCGASRLSYRELNRQCNQVAHWLLNDPRGVNPGEIVGLYLDKSYRVVLTMLGLWKAGAAYVPLAPSFPAERVLFTLRDTKARRIIVNRHSYARLSELLGDARSGFEIIAIEAVLEATSSDVENPRLGLGSRQVAYITYTSGTTGMPKGVPKEHRSVVNSITDLSDRYRMREAGSENVALFAAVVFEPFMRQTLIALINCQTLTIVPDDIRLDPLRLPRFVAEHGITYLNGTRSVLQHFDMRHCPSLTRMLLVGEELTPSGLRTLREKFDGRIINEYAFTETAFVTAIKEYAPGDAERTDRSIGRPVRNVKCYILSRNLKRVPIGAIGELYIGGCGVAAGYLNREDLTAQRFSANPFQSEDEKRVDANARIYQTGDLARLLPDGQIEFMGRSDFQLKLNGVRVEPGEIESRVLEYPGVRQCVVIARGEPTDTGNWRLLGYYVADIGRDVSEAELIAFLESRLIRVMVPARMVRMDQLPVNINGKIDRRALPDIELEASHAPGTQTDSGVCVSGSDGLLDRVREAWSEVLGVPATRISPADDFFRLGGQSITCLRLLMRIWHRLRIVMSVEDVYRLKTLAQVTEYLALQTAQAPEKALAIAEAGQHEAPDNLRANGLQQGLMYQALKSGATNDAYVMQSLYHYHCSIDPQVMARAWDLVQRQYPSLRLRFQWRDDPVQCVCAEVQRLPWRHVDLNAIEDGSERDWRIEELRRQDRLEPYQLDRGPLFRVYLIKQRDDLFTLLFSCHHIILDGWSLPVLHDAVHRLYISLCRHETIEIREDLAYLAAQRYLAAHRRDHLTYWQEQVDRITERGDFAGLLNARCRYKVDLSSYDTVTEHRSKAVALSADCTGSIRRWCAQNRITLHSVLQLVWHEVLHAIGGSRTTVVGTIVSGRNLPIDGIEDSVGLYINTLPLVVDHGARAGYTVAAALAEIQQSVNRMHSRSTVELSAVQTDGAKRRLFDTLLVLENYPRLLSDDEVKRHQDLLRFEKSYDSDKVDYPVAVVAREEGEQLKINLWYAGELFDTSAIETLLGTVETLFQQIAGDFMQPVDGLRYISSATQRQFDVWNRTQAPFPEERTLHAAFELAAERWPHAVAVVSGVNQLTYQELNRRANQLAHLLLATVDLRPDDLVGLVMDKSEWMITAILAVWKAGAAYVPIDPAYPDDRVGFMLDDTAAKVILVDAGRLARLERIAGAARGVLGVQSLPLDEQPCHAPLTAVVSRNLAYAIYTSGTTGRPKAVLIEHRGVINLHTSLERLFALRKDQGDEAILSFSNYVFDHFVEQMTDALLSGQKLVVLDDNMRSDQAQLYAYMRVNGVTYLSGTPSVLSLYEYSTVPSLKRIDAIGEDFTTPVFMKIRASFRGTIINGYGPTEISITSHKRLYHEDEARSNKSIGHPVANTCCYVLNARMQPVPIGGIGELYIGGVGVARGYLNRDQLTAERFIVNPLQEPQDRAQGVNGRLYKTGDLVRWLPNGELEYLGRNDLQIKIRGQRVELGEIEAVLSSHPLVSRSFVVAREQAGRFSGDGAAQKYLVAFYLSECDLSEKDLVRWMRTKLPQALVPVRVMRILQVPVTSSGKLDVSRLPATEFAAAAHVDYAAPANPLETALCRIWASVLGSDGQRIGVRDDFFGLGGDSLRAIKLAQLITERLALACNVAAVFAHPTIEGQSRHLRQSERLLNEEESLPVGLASARVSLPPTSLAQERLLFIDDFVGGTAAYNIPLALELRDSTHDDVNAALRVLLRRHAALRTLMEADSADARVQRVLSEQEGVERFDLVAATVENSIDLDRALIDAAGHVFRLQEELPIRARIFKLAGSHAELFVSLVFHHTCFDGWSWGIIRQELHALLAGADPGSLPVLQATYADFAVWQHQQLTANRLQALTRYWHQALAGWEPLRLPTDYVRPAQFDYRGQEIVFDIDRRTTEQLRSLARAARISLFSVLLAAHYRMLAVYTGQNDLIVGTPSANRKHRDFDGVVGFFVNLLALRVRIDTGARLMDFLRSVGDLVVQAQLHEELPFEQVVKSLGVEPDTSRHPLVQVVFSLLNEEVVQSDGPDMQLYVPDDAGRTTAKFDLATTVSVHAQGSSVNFTYATSLFDPASIEGMIATYQQILGEFCRLAPTADLAFLADVVCVTSGAGLALPDNGDRLTRATDAQSASVETLHGAFELIVRNVPDRIALSVGEKHLSYDELNGRANQMAHHLLARGGLQPNDLVALVMDKSEWLIIALLAVWKAGAAYVPIDPGYPDERISFMLEDTGVSLVLADEVYCERLQGSSTPRGCATLAVQTLPLEKESCRDPATPVSSGHFAYAIYTSGTTGRPKAVLVRHGNVLSFRADIVARYFGAAPSVPQAVLFLASYVFDFSVEQLALSILSGHKLIVPESSLTLDAEFYQRMNREGLTYLSGTPTHLQQFDLSQFDQLRQVLVAGEAFQLHHFEKIRREYAGPLFNAYGTTETTVYNLVERFDPGMPYRNSLGQPIGNTQLHVLDPGLRLLPVGSIGEAYIAGDCVSAGYLNRSALTQERFIQNPLQTEAQWRRRRSGILYKTGDLVRRRTDGSLEFHGRNDSQVKVRGIRIELGEIEAVIASFAGIRQCAVVAHDDVGPAGGKRLAGYYVSEAELDVDETALIAHLRAKLIPAMIPASLTRVERALPQTVNGKLDVESLARWERRPPRSFGIVPLTRSESRLCQIWSDALEGAAVGVSDGFFQLGGDSMAALHLVSQIRREFGRRVTVKNVFDFPTVRAFADNVLRGSSSAVRVTDCAPLTGDCPLLPIQQWFFNKPLMDRGHWNQFLTVRTPSLDIDRLRSALHELVQHHDAFRFRYRRCNATDSASFVQFYGTRDESPLHILDVRGLDRDAIEAQLDGFQGGFDLEQGPLVRTVYLHGFADGSARVWMSLHHLIVDAVSWRILCRDLEILYHGGELGLPGSTFRDWVQALQARSAEPGEAQLWEQIAQGVAAEGIALPPAVAGGAGGSLQFALKEEATALLLGQGNRVFDTRALDLMLTALGYALRELTGKETHFVTLESHGREAFEGAPDVQDTLGWFTTSYPVAVSSDADIGTSIVATKANLSRIPLNGIGYGSLRGAYGSERAPLPGISFNYLGRFADPEAGPRADAPGDSRWRLDAERCGSSKSKQDGHSSDSLIDVTVRCIGNRLVAEIDSRLAVSTTERFTAQLQARLEQIASYTAAMLGTVTRPVRPVSTAGGTDFEPYFKVNETASGPTLFLFPPGEGGAESYLNNIARSLPDVKLVLFNNIHLHAPLNSFESIAQYYLPYVRDLQRAGPYHFFGWSFGGVLALEISLQLLRSGQSVANLLLVDPFCNVRKTQTDLGLSEHENSLDPINHRFQPDDEALHELADTADNIILFKATETVKTLQSAEQRRVFAHYARSSFNNLETWLPATHFCVESLGTNDHFSWVFDERLVGVMSARIRAAILGNATREFRVGPRNHRRLPPIAPAVAVTQQR